MSLFTKKTKRVFSILAFVALLSVVLTSTVSACPNCKEAFANSKPGEPNLARGFYYSILFMLGTPITVITFYGVAFYRCVKKAKNEHDIESTDHVTPTDSLSYSNTENDSPAR